MINWNVFPTCVHIFSSCAYTCIVLLDMNVSYICMHITYAYILHTYTLYNGIHCTYIYIASSSTMYTVYFVWMNFALKYHLLPWHRMTLNSSRSWRARTAPRPSTRRTPTEPRSRTRTRKTSMRKILERRKRERARRTLMMRMERMEKVLVIEFKHRLNKNWYKVITITITYMQMYIYLQQLGTSLVDDIYSLHNQSINF